MIRIFCTDCKKVKRMRQIPEQLESAYPGNEDPTSRKGLCRFHANGGSLRSSRAESQDRVHKVRTNHRVSKPSTPPAPAKRKK